MEEKKKYSGKTVNEAITNACTSLGVPSKRLDYRVVQQPSNGFLGIGSRAAIIEAWIRTEKRETAPAPAEKPAETSAAVAAASSDTTETSGKAKDIVSLRRPAKEETGKADTDKTAGSEKAAAVMKSAVPEDVKKAGQAETETVDIEHFVSADEIEKRAAAAPAYEETGSAENERPGYAERRGQRRYGSKERRGRNGGRPDRRRTRDHQSQGTPVVVDNTVHTPSKPKPERKVKQRTEDEIEILRNTAGTFLKDVLSHMGTECVIETAYDAKTGTLSCVMSGSDMGILIGKRGQTLDSLQYLTSLAVNKKTDEYVRVKLDTEDYRERREETLRNLAHSIAYKVRNTGEAFALEPMNPYERRIIHSSLQNSRYVETYSEGEEPYRHVIIAPKRR